MKLVKNENEKKQEKITDEEAREAFVKILKWIGEDPTREGLLESPKRVTKAFKEYFKGYQEDPKEILNKTFGDVEGYSDMVVQKNISVQSHCEHHMAPIIGIDSSNSEYINGGIRCQRSCCNNRFNSSVYDYERY